MWSMNSDGSAQKVKGMVLFLPDGDAFSSAYLPCLLTSTFLTECFGESHISAYKNSPSWLGR